ncbi:MAG: hypothetical protein Q8K75_11770 [Chlamydiales bacterium]|nr:hypothetical protein [Chlamydiales bacterium]
MLYQIQSQQIVNRLLPFWKPKPTPPTVGEKLQSAVGLVAKIVLIGLATSAALYCGGQGLVQAGLYLQKSVASMTLCGQGLVKAGFGAAWIGKKLFLSIAVPIYAVVYVLPKEMLKGAKWLVSEVLPQLSSLLRTVAHKVIKIACQCIERLMCDVVIPLAAHLIRLCRDYILPALQVLFEAVRSAYNTAIETISTITVTIAKHAFAAISEAYCQLSTLISEASAALWETLTVTVPEVTNQTITAIQEAFSNTIKVLDLAWT